MTGPMLQIYGCGRGDLSLEERLAVELDYIENLSLARNFEMLKHTVGPVLNGRDGRILTADLRPQRLFRIAPVAERWDRDDPGRGPSPGGTR